MLIMLILIWKSAFLINDFCEVGYGKFFCDVTWKAAVVAYAIWKLRGRRRHELPSHCYENGLNSEARAILVLGYVVRFGSN